MQIPETASEIRLSESDSASMHISLERVLSHKIRAKNKKKCATLQGTRKLLDRPEPRLEGPRLADRLQGGRCRHVKKSVENQLPSPNGGRRISRCITRRLLLDKKKTRFFGTPSVHMHSRGA